MDVQKITVQDIRSLKGRRKITCLTAYDYPFAVLVDKAGIDIVLVGDSLANVVLGLESTTQVGMTEMLYHSKAVSRAVKRALIVGDMPFEAYQVNPKDGLANARRFIDEAGCDCVKVEWFDHCIDVVRALVGENIGVMGHIGLTPQTADKLGGFKVQGKDAQAAQRLIEQALELEKAGCFSLVLECVPDRISGLITARLKIPTIGIGAGPECDGQVLVLHDALGLFDRYIPKFVKKFIDLSPLILGGLEDFKNQVQTGVFPDKPHSFSISEDEWSKLKNI
ncbi:MAG TPA: 3-methyl-2-oxobutanoate hydroxymethyltransferase [Candidatus Omnitrophota bacterium]|nr:3-methyl-2-oxobutanoate hydroxymethyltransferase [Candidatus Omnitrophota bacterium]HRZ14892.1 3-methyl-2-oxobutanoate hydroxymethyltransferase [Candidatus Omnitrophota bacterium]